MSSAPSSPFKGRFPPSDINKLADPSVKPVGTVFKETDSGTYLMSLSVGNSQLWSIPRVRRLPGRSAIRPPPAQRVALAVRAAAALAVRGVRAALGLR